jgi:hypothetical protein
MVTLLVTSICKCWLNIDTYSKDISEIAKCLKDDNFVIQCFCVHATHNNLLMASSCCYLWRSVAETHQDKHILGTDEVVSVGMLWKVS